MTQQDDLTTDDVDFMRRNKVAEDADGDAAGGGSGKGPAAGKGGSAEVVKILDRQRLQDRAERAYERLQDAIDEALASAPAIAEDDAHAKLVTNKVVTQILNDSGNSRLTGAAYRRKVIDVTKEVIEQEKARAAKVAGVEAGQSDEQDESAHEGDDDVEAAQRITARDEAAGNGPARASGSESAAQKGPAKAPADLAFGEYGIGGDKPYPSDRELAIRHQERLAAFVA